MTSHGLNVSTDGADVVFTYTAITCICLIVVAAGPKGGFLVSSQTTTYFSYDKTATHRLVVDHERRSKDSQRKTTTDGKI